MLSVDDMRILLNKEVLSPQESELLTMLIDSAKETIKTITGNPDLFITEDPFPGALSYCLYRIVSQQFLLFSEGRIGINSETYGEYSVKFAPDKVPWLVNRLLERYSKISIA